MNSRGLLNLALVMLVAGLAWAFYSPAPTPPGPAAPPLSRLDPAQVRSITLQLPGQPALVLERPGEEWVQRAPLGMPANSFKANSLLSMLRAPARPITGGALADYGLAPPKAVAGFDHARIEIGGTEPVSGKRYLRRDGQVLLLEDAWFTHLFATPERWVDPRPLGAAPRLERLQFAHVRWHLRDGQWRRTPADPGGDAGEGARLARAWSESRALAVSSVNPDLPWSTAVTLGLVEPAVTRSFRIARAQRMVFLSRRDPPLQYQFSERQAAEFLPAEVLNAAVR